VDVPSARIAGHLESAYLIAMKRSWFVSAMFLVAYTSPLLAKEPSAFKYPDAPTSDHVDDYHGTKVPDPYRPLENADSPESRKWIEQQNELTFAFLNSIPARKEINHRLTKLWNYEKYGVPFREGDRYFFSKNTGLQNQSVFFTASALPGDPRVLLDPNTLSKDGTTALSGVDIPMTESMSPTAWRWRDRIGRSGRCATSRAARISRIT
jgi:hypothetical protein